VSHEEFRRKFSRTDESLHSTVSPQDIANMRCSLCSEAGARITGQALPVDAMFAIWSELQRTRGHVYGVTSRRGKAYFLCVPR